MKTPADASSQIISVIVPAWNEARTLPATLAALAENRAAYELIVTDGGSLDGTADLARQQGARVLSGGLRQRAAQMNAGALRARGDVFLFLHADTLLAPTALDSVRAAAARGVAGGAFARRYASPSAWLAATCSLANWRGRLSGWFLGDQAIFARREVFERLGGFRDLDLFEDLDFARRMRRLGPTVLLQPAVVSSARRFVRRGPLRTSLEDFRLTLLYALGRDPNALAARPSAAPVVASQSVISS